MFLTNKIDTGNRVDSFHLREVQEYREAYRREAGS